MVHKLSNLSNYSRQPVGISYAKPNREIVFKFGQGKLNITGSTMDFLMFLSPFVDVDGRITIPLEVARRKLCMQAKTFFNTREEARANGLIYIKDGEYYSKFHIPIDGTVTGLKYQKLVQEYTAPSVLEYSLKLKRLFYYFASFTRMGEKKVVTIENLYKNNLHMNTYGISYFDTFSELSKAILTLIKNDQIHVQLMVDQDSNSGPILTSETTNLEETFLSFFGSKDGKKERTSNLKSERHKIKVHMTQRVVNNEVLVIASETEIKEYSSIQGIPWEEISRETKNYLFNYKNELFQLLGETGLAIYRNSLRTYLKENAELVLYHDLVSNKTANYVMDFYIIPEVKNILVGAAHHPRVMKEKVSTNHLLLNGYFIEISKLAKILRYYLDRASINHLVQLDALLDKVDYVEFKMNSDLWKTLDTDVFEIYRERYSQFSNVLSPIEWKQIVREWADHGLLTAKKEFEETIKNLKNQVYFVSGYKSRHPFVEKKEITMRVKHVPFYNWLEERD